MSSSSESRPTIPVPADVAEGIARAEAIFAEAEAGEWALQATSVARANAPFPCDHVNATCAYCDDSGNEE